MDEVKIENRLATLETTVQYIADQIIDMQESQSEIHSLALSVNSLASSVKRLVEDMCSMGTRVERLESKPGLMWDKVVGYVLAALVSGALGYILANIF